MRTGIPTFLSYCKRSLLPFLLCLLLFLLLFFLRFPHVPDSISEERRGGKKRKGTGGRNSLLSLLAPPPPPRPWHSYMAVAVGPALGAVSSAPKRRGEKKEDSQKIKERRRGWVTSHWIEGGGGAKHSIRGQRRTDTREARKGRDPLFFFSFFSFFSAHLYGRRRRNIILQRTGEK